MLDEGAIAGAFVGTESILSGADMISAFEKQEDSTSVRQREPTFDSWRNLHMGVAEGLVELVLDLGAVEELADVLHVGVAEGLA